MGFQGMPLPTKRAITIAGAALGLRSAAPRKVAIAGFSGWSVDGTAGKATRRPDGGTVLQGDAVRLTALRVAGRALVVVVNSRPGEFRAFMETATIVLGSLKLGSAYARVSVRLPY